MAEVYANITGYPNYQVSTFGNVKNVKTGRILKGFENGFGYLRVGLINEDSKCYMLIHKMASNAFLENPENKECVDHIDRNRKNNHISNLRFATKSENQQNSSIYSTNTSGKTGVRFNKQKNKWQACIMLNYKNKHLGFFDEKDDAIQARKDGEIQYFGEFRAV
jgi:hypothetical protein